MRTRFVVCFVVALAALCVCQASQAAITTNPEPVEIQLNFTGPTSIPSFILDPENGPTAAAFQFTYNGPSEQTWTITANSTAPPTEGSFYLRLDRLFTEIEVLQEIEMTTEDPPATEDDPAKKEATMKEVAKKAAAKKQKSHTSWSYPLDSSGANSISYVFTTGSSYVVEIGIINAPDPPFTIDFSPLNDNAPVPEPTSLAIWGSIGLAGFVARWRRRGKQAT